MRSKSMTHASDRANPVGTVRGPSRLRLLCLGLALVAGNLFLGTGVASAIEAHPSLTASFGPDGSAGTSFQLAKSVNLDKAARKLYVLEFDGAAGRIHGFSLATPGTFTPLAAFNPFVMGEVPEFDAKLGVDNTALPSAGTIYAPGQKKLFSVSPAGAPPGGKVLLEDLSGGFRSVTVDPSGNVWASTVIEHRLYELSPSGSLLRTINTEGGVESIQFDAAGNLYVAGVGGNGFTGWVWKYAAPGYESPVRFLKAGAPFAISRSTGDLYFLNRFPGEGQLGVRRYDSQGQLLETFAQGVAGQDVAVDDATNDVYVPAGLKVNYYKAVNLPLAITGGASNPSAGSVTLKGTVRPDGQALTDCRFEYVTKATFEASGFADLSSGGSVPCVPAAGSIPADSATHAVSATPSGLNSGVPYRFRLVAANANGDNPGQSAGFELGAPLVETVGAPVRSATTAQLNGRVFAHGIATSYHFDYVSDEAFQSSGFADLSSGGQTPAKPTGPGDLTELVAEEITGLTPNTTYRYRVVAENGGVPSVGAEMAVTTRASDKPLSHGHFPGPPGSDRAYELVSLSESSGNPVFLSGPFAEDGERALFQINGGTPESTIGDLKNFYYSERTPSGWKASFLSPPRDQLVGSIWQDISVPPDLTSIGARNYGAVATALWRMRPNAPPEKLFEKGPLQKIHEGNDVNGYIAIAADSPRTIVPLEGGELDPAFPAAWAHGNLYDVSSGTPQLVSLLPDGNPAPCGIDANGYGNVKVSTHPLADDGSWMFFSAAQGCGLGAQLKLYVRDLEADQTKLVSGPALSGSECEPGLIEVSDDAAYFWTSTRLDPADTPSACGGNGDVYRYEISSEELKCLTCVLPGTDVNVASTGSSPRQAIAVAGDGSRVYFQSSRALLPGAASGERNLYVVEVGTGELRWVTRFSGQSSESFGELALGAAISHDGSSIRFYAKGPILNPLGGQDNGDTLQYYRYDDRDRSLLCASCPTDGSAPRFAAAPNNGTDNALSDAGDLIFDTPEALVGADQNTPRRPGVDPRQGTDVYEWRDGRLLLISDGLTVWPADEIGGAELGPKAQHIDRSGRNAFFIAPAQYTRDALDGFGRLYDARIGGGIEIPVPPPPCSLEVCQGTPKGVPEEQAPGTQSFRGQGNSLQPAASRCPKGKRKATSPKGKKRCVARPTKRSHRRANHSGRAQR